MARQGQLRIDGRFDRGQGFAERVTSPVPRPERRWECHGRTGFSSRPAYEREVGFLSEADGPRFSALAADAHVLEPIVAGPGPDPSRIVAAHQEGADRVDRRVRLRPAQTGRARWGRLITSF